MDVALLLMVLGVMLSGFWAADALDHMRKEIKTILANMVKPRLY